MVTTVGTIGICWQSKNNQNLNDYPLSGLETVGVPNSLSGSIPPFI